MAFGRLLSAVNGRTRRLSLTAQFVVGFAPVFVLVCLTSYLVYSELQEARVRNNAAAAEVRAIALHNSLIKAVVDAETGLRGFLLTGDSEFLAPYRSAEEEFSKAADSLVETYGANSVATDRLQELRDIFRYWRGGVARPLIEERRRAPPELDRRTDRVRDMFARFVERLAVLDSAGAIPQGLQVDLADATARLDMLTERAGGSGLAARYTAMVERARAFRSDLRGAAESGLSAAEIEGVRKRARTLLSDLDALTEAVAAAEASIVERVQSQQGMYVIDRIRRINEDMLEERRAERSRAFELADAATATGMWVGTLAPLAAFAFGIAAMAVVAGRAVRRIHRIQAVADELGRGDLTARADVVNRGDELNELGHRFNHMASELQGARTETDLMARFRDLLVTSETADEAFRVMERLGPSFFPGTEGCVYLIAESRNVAMPMAAWPGSPDEYAILRPADCRGLRAGRTHVLSGDAIGVVCPHLENVAPVASVCVPLTAQDNVLGLLTLWSHAQQGDEQTSAAIDDRLALRVAEQLALFLANVRLREQLRDQSIRDPLTDLFNRRYLDETLERELQRAMRNGEPLSVVSLDIDHFKRFNDTQGHDAGDAVLVAVANDLQRWLRPSDIACRMGGEEFLLVLPGASLSVASTRAEQIRTSVGELTVNAKGHDLPSVSISLGVAVVPEHAHSTEMLLRHADDALYAAKRNGRNRVEVAQVE